MAWIEEVLQKLANNIRLALAKFKCVGIHVAVGTIDACRFRLGGAHDRHSPSSIRET